MNRKLKATALSILIGALVLVFGNDTSFLHAQDNTGTNQTTVKEKPDGLVVDWLNDFEECEDWRAEATCPLGETKIRKYPGKPRPMKDGQPINENNEVGKEFADKTEPDENGIAHDNKFVLGVKTYFMDRGFDRVEVFPPKNN